MEVKVQSVKPKGIRMEPNEIAVKVGGTIAFSKTNTVEKLRSLFEENLQILRQTLHPIKLPEFRHTQIVLPSKPILAKHLNPLWDLHLQRFACITKSFETSLKYKIENTHRLRRHRKEFQDLKVKANQDLQERLMIEARIKVKEAWIDSLEKAREILGEDTYDIDVLCEKMVKRICIEIPTEKILQSFEEEGNGTDDYHLILHLKAVQFDFRMKKEIISAMLKEQDTQYELASTEKMARLYSEIIAEEEKEIHAARDSIQKELQKIEKEMEKFKSSETKPMQIAVDLALQMARESLWNNGLVEIASIC